MRKKITPKVLKQCREQLGLSPDEVEKKLQIKTLKSIESGKKDPTIKQIYKLSEKYLVPPWVFTRETLPEKYNFKKANPSFRKFSNSSFDFNFELRSLIQRVENLRELILDLREDMQDPISSFSPPEGNTRDTSIISQSIRTWLNPEDICLDFDSWRKKLEDNDVFIFVTSIYKGWSHVKSDSLRGFSLYHEKLPIIIINASDTYRAKSFTLFHELGHLLQKKTKPCSITSNDSSQEEKWCDELSGKILMPDSKIEKYSNIQNKLNSENKLKEINKAAKEFKVSSYAFLVRVRKLNYISQKEYKNIEDLLKKEYEEKRKELKRKKEMGKEVKISRDRPKEILTEYGRVYLRTIMQAYADKEITLHKLRNMVNAKKTEHVLKLEKIV